MDQIQILPPPFGTACEIQLHDSSIYRLFDDKNSCERTHAIAWLRLSLGDRIEPKAFPLKDGVSDSIAKLVPACQQG
jgi:hypothetical protein